MPLNIIGPYWHPTDYITLDDGRGDLMSEVLKQLCLNIILVHHSQYNFTWICLDTGMLSAKGLKAVLDFTV